MTGFFHVYRYPGRILLLLAFLLISACDWVDSTGIQAGDPADQRIALIEETQKNIEFSVPVSSDGGQSQVQSWSQVEQGALSACSRLINLNAAAATLDEACTAQETDCELLIVEIDNSGPAANGENQYQHSFSVFPPALSSPIALKYRWEFLDDTGNPVTQDLHLCIDAVNQPPDARDDRYIVTEDSGLTINNAVYDSDCILAEQNPAFASVLYNDTDDHHLKGPCLRAELVEPPSYAANDVSAEFSSSGGFSYVPGAGRDQTVDYFTYRVFDGSLYSEEATITILIPGEFTYPDADPDVFVVRRNSTNNLLQPLDNDTDPENTALEIVSISGPSAGGTVTIENGNTLEYTPARGFRGSDFFRYTIENEFGQQDDALIRVRVR